MKFSAKQRKAIEAFAIDYNAFNRHCDGKDNNGIRVWGKALLVSQAEVGIELMPASSIKAMICAAENEA
jgi:hypothetical protein